MLKKISRIGIPIFFVSPILGFIASILDIRSKNSAIVYVAFAGLFGYAISFADPSADSYRYALAFNEFDNTLNYHTIVQMYQNGALRDMYRLLLFYFSSIFTSNPKVMYAIAGIIYGFLSYKAMLILSIQNKNKLNIYIFILNVVFFTYVSLANINGFRFWTGALMLFYAVYQNIVLGKTKWLLVILITPLFHYGFILAMPILFLYKLIENKLFSKEKISNSLFIIFCLTFAGSFILGTNSINLGFLTQSVALSGAIGDRLNYVNSEDVAELVDKRKDNSTFLSVQTYFDYAIKIFVFISIVFLRKLFDQVIGDRKSLVTLFNFVLYFYSFAFIATTFPSGGRFLSIAHLFLILLIAKFFAISHRKSLKKLILCMLPIFSFHILFVNFMLPYLILTSVFWYGNFFWILIEGWGYNP